MKKTLLLLAHPDLKHSLINRTLVESIMMEPSMSIRDLYSLYSDINRIDVEEEQKQLIAHDRVLIQFPLYWFSTPALLKEWQDRVLTYGFAYGEGGTKLVGKRCGIVFSAGSPETAYSSSGHNLHPIESYLLPLLGSIRYTGMEYGGSFGVYGALRMGIEALSDETARYATWLKEEGWL